MPLDRWTAAAVVAAAGWWAVHALRRGRRMDPSGPSGPVVWGNRWGDPDAELLEDGRDRSAGAGWGTLGGEATVLRLRR